MRPSGTPSGDHPCGPAQSVTTRATWRPSASVRKHFGVRCRVVRIVWTWLSLGPVTCSPWRSSQRHRAPSISAPTWRRLSLAGRLLISRHCGLPMDKTCWTDRNHMPVCWRPCLGHDQTAADRADWLHEDVGDPRLGPQRSHSNRARNSHAVFMLIPRSPGVGMPKVKPEQSAVVEPVARAAAASTGGRARDRYRAERMTGRLGIQ